MAGSALFSATAAVDGLSVLPLLFLAFQRVFRGAAEVVEHPGGGAVEAFKFRTSTEFVVVVISASKVDLLVQSTLRFGGFLPGHFL